MMPKSEPSRSKLGRVTLMPTLKNPAHRPQMLTQNSEMRIFAPFFKDGENTVYGPKPLPSQVTTTQGAIPLTPFRADANGLMSPESRCDNGRLDNTDAVRNGLDSKLIQAVGPGTCLGTPASRQT